MSSLHIYIYPLEPVHTRYVRTYMFPFVCALHLLMGHLLHETGRVHHRLLRVRKICGRRALSCGHSLHMLCTGHVLYTRYQVQGIILKSPAVSVPIGNFETKAASSKFQGMFRQASPLRVVEPCTKRSPDSNAVPQQ